MATITAILDVGCHGVMDATHPATLLTEVRGIKTASVQRAKSTATPYMPFSFINPIDLVWFSDMFAS
jgi:hypothetical protein